MDSTLVVLASVAQDTVSSESLLFAFIGLFVWELFETWDVEYSVLASARWRQFPLAQYTLCRIFTLTALIGLAISHTIHHEIDCKALYRFCSFASDMAVLTALTLFTTHTTKMFNDQIAIKIPLLALCAASAAVLFAETFAVDPGAWDRLERACVRAPPTSSSERALQHASFFLPFATALALLAAAAFGALGRPRLASIPLGSHLLDSGLAYYPVALLLALPAILNAAHVDVDVDDIALVPAFVLTAVAALRLARTHALRPAPGAPGEDLFVHTASLVSAPHASVRMRTAPRPSRVDFTPEPFSAGPSSPVRDKDAEAAHDDDDGADGASRRWSQDSRATRELSIKFTHP